jgi:hypothetical protein
MSKEIAYLEIGHAMVGDSVYWMNPRSPAHNLRDSLRSSLEKLIEAHGHGPFLIKAINRTPSGNVLLVFDDDHGKEQQINCQWFVASEISLLIQKFEDEIQYDAHALVTKVSRSIAAKQFLEMKREALSPISKYLRLHKPTDELGLSTAWCLLLSWIEKELELPDISPSTLTNVDEWINWAEKHATAQSG